MLYVRLLFKVETNGTIADKINNTTYETVYINWPAVFVFYLNIFEKSKHCSFKNVHRKEKLVFTD